MPAVLSRVVGRSSTGIRVRHTEVRLGIVGHTAFFLPIATPFRDLRASARRLLISAMDVFAAVGATLVNVHPIR